MALILDSEIMEYFFRDFPLSAYEVFFQLLDISSGLMIAFMACSAAVSPQGGMPILESCQVSLQDDDLHLLP
eukprot:15347702-Ditylum_brightwellii.AAC.1